MKPAVILTVIGLMVGLYGVDRFLAALEQTELTSEATRHYARGESLLAQNRPSEAVDEFSRAHSLARRNANYQLALARALIATNRLPEAETNLDSLLDQDSNDGRANLAMARLLVKKDRVREADAYYHRALYSHWYGPAQTAQVRMELAEFLASKGLRQELLSELLLLQDHDEGPAWRSNIGRLFLASGSPGRAVAVYRALLKQDPENVEAEVGLGEAALAQGDFRSASRAFLEALRRRPGDQATISRLQLATLLNSLDPTPRRLASGEKFTRSNKILDLAAASLTACVQTRSAQPEVQQLLNSAVQAASSKVKGSPTNELSEERLSLAEQIWRQRVNLCGPSGTGADPLPLIMHKLAQ